MTRAASSLSGDEVAALMDELSDISFDENAEGAEAQIPALQEVATFALGQLKDRPVAHLAHLERMNERIARRLRDVIEKAAQAGDSTARVLLDTWPRKP